MDHYSNRLAGSEFEQHRRQLGRSVWLYLWLQRYSRGDGLVAAGRSLTASGLGEALGIGPRQARRDLTRLKEASLINLRNTGRGYQVWLRPLIET